VWPWALPGAAPAADLLWRVRTRRHRVCAGATHAAATGIGPIEELLACTLCGESRVRPLFEIHRGRHHYHVVRCPACGLLYRNPGVRPERLGDLYAGRYGRFLEGKYKGKRKRRYRLVLDAYAPLFAHGEGRRLLDYGCGTGLFLDLAEKRGFEPFGVDLSADAITRARARASGRNAHFGHPLDVPEIARGGFDVVCLWSVLAHLPRPVEDLAMLRGLLAPDGVLVILTVNANSLALRVQGARWGAFTPNHLVFFAPASLTRALAGAGFGAVVMRPALPDPVEAGTSRLRPALERRLRRTTQRGNRGNMLRAVAFADPAGPARWGMAADAVALGPARPAVAPGRPSARSAS